MGVTKEHIDVSRPRGSDRAQFKATARILTALSAFASDVDNFGVTELALQLGMSKNMVYRALTTLADQGYVVRDASTQRYQLGYRVLELQNRFRPEPDLRALCAPFLTRFQGITGETSSLLVRAFDYTVMIDGLETRLPGTYRLVIGAIFPLHAPASGVLLLAMSGDAEIEAYIARNSPMKLYQGQETLPAKELWKRIRETRKRGYAQVIREDAVPMLSVAFPVWASNNQLHGVLASGGPVTRFGPQLPAMLPRIMSLLDELNQRSRLYPADPQQWAIS
jgi:DNA-binding IclR family transcriptional regulator